MQQRARDKVDVIAVAAKVDSLVPLKRRNDRMRRMSKTERGVPHGGLPSPHSRSVILMPQEPEVGPLG